MRRAAQNSSARPRSRRKPADVPRAAPVTEPRNVGSVEALLSLTVGMLIVIAALVPRSFKQVFLLALGGGLLHRGLTGDCGFYREIGINTAQGSRPAQTAEKLKASSKA